MTTNVAKCLLVSKVLVADGMMSDDEHVFLAALMTKLELSPDERQQVTDLEGWDEADGILKDLPIDERRELVSMLVDAASADGKLSAQELAVAKKVAAALDVRA